VDDDRRLFDAWCAGDRAAGAALFDRHYESVARFFHNKVADTAASDLIQNTFLGCVEARDRFRGESGFRTFLFAVARNLLHKHYREHQGPRGRVDFGEVTACDLAPTASAVLRADEEKQLLLQALRRIPIECQEALELLYWEKLAVAEIAEIVGIPVGTVKTRLHRGRRLLEEQMALLAETPELLESTLANLDGWAEGVRAQMDEKARTPRPP
jgi:RNA polymerase sigma-70 factor (ECF subfamily)